MDDYKTSLCSLCFASPKSTAFHCFDHKPSLSFKNIRDILDNSAVAENTGVWVEHELLIGPYSLPLLLTFLHALVQWEPVEIKHSGTASNRTQKKKKKNITPQRGRETVLDYPTSCSTLNNS